MKLVSAVITTYKRPVSILKRAISSVLSQSYNPIELIIVDDNREDAEGTEFSKAIAALIEEIKKDSKISIFLYKTEDNKHGGQAARNTGIHNAHGEYIAFLDDDDERLSEKIKKQVQKLDDNPAAGMCFCNGNRINENFTPPKISNYNSAGVKKSVTYKELLKSDCIGTTTQAMITKKALNTVGGFDEEFPARQDYEMWVRISTRFSIVGIEENLFNYYISKNNQNGQVAQNMDNCIRGHKLLYQKYKADIDKDRAAKYNVEFYLAHYYYFGGSKIKGILQYIKAFFIYPMGFYNSGKEKIRQIKEKKGN